MFASLDSREKDIVIDAMEERSYKYEDLLYLYIV